RREKILASESLPLQDGGPVVQSIGTYQLTWPRTQLLNRCGRRLARRLIDHWMRKDAKPIAEEIAQRVPDKWEALGLRAEALIARHQERCEAALKQPPDRYLTGLVAPVAAMIT